MAPSTLSFVLRWQTVPFLAGIAIASLGGYLLWTFQPDPPSLGVESGVSLVGIPVYVAGLIFGLFLIVSAWTKAERIRNGS